MFKNLKIGVRLGMGFGFVALLLTCIAALAFAKLSALNTEIGDLMCGDSLPLRRFPICLVFIFLQVMLLVVLLGDGL